MFFKIFKKIIREINEWISCIIRFIPGKIGIIFRYHIYKFFFSSCGKNVSISNGCYIRDFKNISLGSNVGFGLNSQIYSTGIGNEQIEFGNNVYLNSNVMINADIGGNIQICDNVLIGPNVVLRASNHIFSKRNISIFMQGHESGSITIEDDVWLGANVVVLPNVTIGKGAIVGAGAVVTKDIKAYTIVGGVPAHIISNRPEEIN